MKAVWFLLIVWLDLAVMALLAAWADSAAIVQGAPDNGTGITMVYVEDNAGDVMQFGSRHQWLYVGHFPYQASIHANGATTCYQNFKSGMTAWDKLLP